MKKFTNSVGLNSVWCRNDTNGRSSVKIYCSVLKVRDSIFLHKQDPLNHIDKISLLLKSVNGV